MTTLSTPELTAYPGVAFDLYRDIHKGIRSELFALTEAAGRTDPADRAARLDLVAQLRGVVEVLDQHAHHEDAAIQPAIEAHVPDVAETVVADHAAFDRRCELLVELGSSTVDAPEGEARRLAQHLYVDLAAFTSSYLAHQDLEERVVMPALEAALGVEAVVGIHQQILGTMPPDEMVRSLAFMFPAMNVDDRTELLGGMRAGAPAEVFEGVWSLVRSVLCSADVAVLAARLDLQR